LVFRVNRSASPDITPPKRTSDEIGKRKLPPVAARKRTQAIQTHTNRPMATRGFVLQLCGPVVVVTAE
jgi:hypothetical protein